MPMPRARNGALLVPRLLSCRFMPAEPVTYQRSSNSWALTAGASARPASSAVLNRRIFMGNSFGGGKWERQSKGVPERRVRPRESYTFRMMYRALPCPAKTKPGTMPGFG